jgi:ribosomal protein S18 acetylase RimI-like enzyme
MGIEIVKPTLNDIPDLLPLWKEQYKLHHNFDPEYYVATTPVVMKNIKRYLQSLIIKPITSILVAKEAGRVVGFITFQKNKERYIDENIRSYAYVEELFVDADCRRKGVGKSLIKGMEKELAKRGVFYTQLSCVIDNEEGLKFYKKIGYRGNHIWFIKKSDVRR